MEVWKSLCNRLNYVTKGLKLKYLISKALHCKCITIFWSQSNAEGAKVKSVGNWVNLNIKLFKVTGTVFKLKNCKCKCKFPDPPFLLFENKKRIVELFQYFSLLTNGLKLRKVMLYFHKSNSYCKVFIGASYLHDESISKVL